MDPAVTPEEARSIVADAYIYAYPMIANYRTMVKQAIDPEAPEYIGGFNVIKNYSQPFTPENRDVVTPNNDTPYSWARLDLRGDPFVMSVPAVSQDRYYVLQWIDLYTYIIGYIGVRSTGFGSGSYLIAGPDWDGETPEGINGVLRSETQFVTLLGRTLLEGPDDIQTLEAVQSQYRLEALSQYLAEIPPPAPPDIDWLPWDDDALTTRQFLPYLNFLLQFCQPTHPSEQELMQRFARVGIGPGLPFDPSPAPAMRQAIDDGVADGIATLNAALAETTTSNGLFGSREELGNDYLKRAVGANKGLYGNAVEEAWYGGWETGSDGEPLDGGKRYQLHFAAEAMPPATYFWSATMYSLPDRLLVANPIDRYAIGDRTKGLQYDEDGGLTILISPEAPDDERLANWLPAPAGPFTVVIRVYGPKPELLNGSWQLPEIWVMGDG